MAVSCGFTWTTSQIDHEIWRQDGYGIETWIEGASYQARSSGRREGASCGNLFENRGFWQPITMDYGLCLKMSENVRKSST